MSREKNLEQMLISTAAGAFIAFILCQTIPEPLASWQMTIYFTIYWLMCGLAAWELIDLVDYIKNGGETWTEEH